MSLVKDYFEKTKQWSNEYGENTVVLMQVGAFFEVYGILEEDGTLSGSKITEVCSICDLAIANKTTGDASSDKLPIKMAGFRDHQLDKYLKRLNDAGWTAAVYSQDASAIKNPTRSLLGVFSPGTYFSDETTAVSNNTMVVWIDTHHASSSNALRLTTNKTFIGIAVADIFTGRTFIAEYAVDGKHNPATYDDLERSISVYSPSEIIIISTFDNKKTREIVQFTGMNEQRVRIICLTSNHNESRTSNNNGFVDKAHKCEKQSYQMETLKTFFENNRCQTSTSTSTSTNTNTNTNTTSTVDITTLFYDYQQTIYGFQSLVFLLNYLFSHNPNLANKIEIPVVQYHTDRLILANHSLKQLNMINDAGQTGLSNTHKFSSVSALLNSAITAGGKRTFMSSLNSPICNIETLQKHYDITEVCLMSNNNKFCLWQTMRDKLRDIKDLEKLNRKLVLKRFTPRDLAFLFDSVKRVYSLYNAISCTDTELGIEWQKIKIYLNTVFNNFNTENVKEYCENIIKFIDERIVFDEALSLETCGFNQYSAECVNKGSCFIKTGFYEELDNACKGGLIWQQQINAIIDYFDGLIAKTETKTKSQTKKTSSGAKFVRLHETTTMSPNILLTKRRSAILKLELSKQKQIIKRGQTQSHYDTNVDVDMNANVSQHEKTISVTLCEGTPAQFSFHLNDISIENASSKADDMISSYQIDELMNKMRNSKDIFNELLSNVFKDLCNQIMDYTEMITNIADFMRYIDLIQSRCYIADKYNYCKPNICKEQLQTSSLSSSFVKATGLRHPLIEHIQTNEIYVTNDIELGENMSGSEFGSGSNPISGILLYGTNAVGKTSLIKALGISVIMAQAGLYVPCSKFEYYPYTSIFTRILGNDNIHRGLSTFAVEMLELRTILKMANKNSLILGDELCSGTESDSALSIFAAGIEKLHELGSSFIFATHFHEVAEFDEVKSLERVCAKHMTVVYNKQLDALVYDRKLKDGAGDSMYGLEVCKSLDLPEDFLERAHSIRNKYNRQTAMDLDMKTSHFNAKKIMGRCEMCKKTGTEVHHLQHQKAANAYNRIKHFHKNHVANLITLCEECHDLFHDTETQYERKKTTKGYLLVPIPIS